MRKSRWSMSVSPPTAKKRRLDSIFSDSLRERRPKRLKSKRLRHMGVRGAHFVTLTQQPECRLLLFWR
jgi:hypothetical protein